MYDIWNDYAEENRYVLNTNHIITGVEVWKNNKGTEIPVNVLVRLFDFILPKAAIQTEEDYRHWIDRYQNLFAPPPVSVQRYHLQRQTVSSLIQ